MTTIDLCRHGFDSTKWLPCPSCNPDDTAVLLGAATTPEQLAHVAVISEAMRGQTLQHKANSRRLQLEGQTLAGCLVGEAAADATQSTRFHTRMSCGHTVIISGTELKMAHKNGKTLRCKPCQKAETASKRAKSRQAKV